MAPSDPPRYEGKKTIAVCVVVVDELIHEDIWRYWVDQSVTSQYNARLFIHAKYPDRITSDWVRGCLIDVTFEPEWNSPEVIRAMLAVMETALIDESCQRFVFATETCIPLYPLEECGAILFESEVSWANARCTPESAWERGSCFLSVDATIIPTEVKTSLSNILSLLCCLVEGSLESCTWLDNADTKTCC